MLDRVAIALIKPAIEALARPLQSAGVSVNQITMFGFAVGVAAAIFISQRFYLTGFALILLSRLLDALDGAVARMNQPSDQGGFLDISFDFLFYASVPLAFAWADSTNNALASATLLAAFLGTSTSFLAFAVLAQKRQLKSTAYPNKSFYFLGGLTEATETLIAFCAMCLFPNWFTHIAFIFAGLCAVTTVTRMIHGAAALKD
jgi:phosphatidylglycerophosphate synthase